MCALKRSGKITPADIPMQLRTVRTKPVDGNEYSFQTLFERTKTHGLRAVLEDIEKAVISEAFQKCKNQIECAQTLKLSTPSITRKLKLFGLK
jgi:DNA-binding NtrC family response regulator